MRLAMPGAKADAEILATVTKRPTGPHQRRKKGYRLRTMNATGIIKYMTPIWRAPIDAMAPGEALSPLLELI